MKDPPAFGKVGTYSPRSLGLVDKAIKKNVEVGRVITQGEELAALTTQPRTRSQGMAGTGGQGGGAVGRGNDGDEGAVEAGLTCQGGRARAFTQWVRQCGVLEEREGLGFGEETSATCHSKRT